MTGRSKLVVALDGPGSSGKSSVGAAAALEVGYRFCDTGLLYRAVTWLALARNVSASYPHAMRGLVDEVELAPDAAGPPRPRPRRRHRSHRRRPRPGGRRRRLRGLGHPGAASRPARAPARRWRRPAGSSWPGATSARSSCPTPTSRSSSTRRSRSGPAGGPRSAGSTPTPRRRSRSSTRSGDATSSTRPVPWPRCAPPPDARIISTDGNRFEDTVDAVVNAIRDVEARRAAEPEPSGASA